MSAGIDPTTTGTDPLLVEEIDAIEDEVIGGGVGDPMPNGGPYQPHTPGTEPVAEDEPAATPK